MSIQEGTVDHFLSEIGSALDDTTLSRTADGTLVRTRVMPKLHAAQVDVQSWLYTRGANPSQLARKVTLTADTENDYTYLLPPRTWGVFAVEDSKGVYYAPCASRLRHYEAGWFAERRASTAGRNNQMVVRFLNFTPTGTIYAWVLEEPCRMSGGDGTYAAATATLEASPDVGQTVMDDDYYNGSQLVITESGSTAFGLIGTVTDYVGATRVATVPTWSTTPTASDNYSVICDLPRQTWRWIVLEATRRLMRVDRRWDDMMNDFRDERNECRINALLSLKRPAKGFANMPREAEVWRV